MANQFRGDVDLITVGEGEERKTYTLRFGANELVLLEDELGKGIGEISEMLTTPGYQPSMRTARLFVWIALKAHHPAITLEQAGEVINAAGVLEAFSAAMTALNRSFPEPKPGQVKEGKAPRRGAGRA